MSSGKKSLYKQVNCLLVEGEMFIAKTVCTKQIACYADLSGNVLLFAG